MKRINSNNNRLAMLSERSMVLLLCLLILFPFDHLKLYAQSPEPSQTTPEDMKISSPSDEGETVFADLGVAVEALDSIPPTDVVADDYAYDETGRIPFNPSPTRAVWLSALCPGLGQIYNRRYWKLPIVIGGFMGLGYATNWNNGQYQDYMQGYRDLLDSDSSTNSYMDFFPSTVKESDLDRDWLERVFKSRKDYYRRNRDLCIIGLVLLYGLCILDSYVDAQLTHFDVSDKLSIDWSPTLLNDPMRGPSRHPAVGLNWAITF